MSLCDGGTTKFSANLITYQLSMKIDRSYLGWKANCQEGENTVTTSISGITTHLSPESKSLQETASQHRTAQSDTAAPKTTTPESAQDSVKLSPAAQARSLKHSGMTVSQIAQQLGVDVKTVNGYLGVTELSSIAGVTAKLTQQ